MAETATKLAVHGETKSAPAAPTRPWYPFETLRREVDRLFEDFDGGFWRLPARQSLFDFGPFGRIETKAGVPAVDIVEKANAYEITAELPGIDEKDIELKLANGGISIRGEKKFEKEEKKADYHLSERRYGAFERYFTIPDGVDTAKIEAKFHNGVLTVSLPKSAEAQKQEKTITVKAA